MFPDRQTGLTRRWIGLSMAILGLVSSTASAQSRDPYIPSSTFDVYGNARALYRQKRSVGPYRNPLTQSTLPDIQGFSQSLSQPRRAKPFALSGDLFSRRRPTTAADLADPLTNQPLTTAHRTALSSYGGFGERTKQPESDLQSVLTRRYTLLAATSYNAPVHRAFLSNPAGTALRSAIQQAPFVSPPSQETPDSAMSLEHWLHIGADNAYQRVNTQAWSWFQKGNYRRAARGFETAARMDPSDIESRIGEMVCHVSVGATRTALAVMAELVRRKADPFAPHLNLAEKYGEPAEVQRIRTMMMVWTQADHVGARVDALRALVLWHLGERTEAERIVGRRSFDAPDDAYADWPALIRAAK